MLEVRDLHSGYGEAHVVRGVSLDVGAGEIVAVLGRNGMGKTTLIRSIMGLTPPQIRSGSITWSGESLIGLRPHHIGARKIASRGTQNHTLEAPEFRAEYRAVFGADLPARAGPG